MIFAPLDATTLPIAAGWLGREDIYRWLDLGYGAGALTPTALAVMAQRDTHCLRVYTPEGATGPVIGVVGLSHISHRFRTGTIWAVLGERVHGGRGHTYRAAERLLTHAFGTLGLLSVQAWTVDVNVASQRILERLGFQCVGRQRQCHLLDGQAHDRILFDLLASEHEAQHAA